VGHRRSRAGPSREAEVYLRGVGLSSEAEIDWLEDGRDPRARRRSARGRPGPSSGVEIGSVGESPRWMGPSGCWVVAGLGPRVRLSLVSPWGLLGVVCILRG
jgi:hypothetical protein